MKIDSKVRPYQFAFALDQIIILVLFASTFYYHQKDLPLNYFSTQPFISAIFVHLALSIVLWFIFRIHKRIIRYYHAIDFIHLILISGLHHLISFGINFINLNPSRRCGKIYLESYIVTVASLIALRYLISFFYEKLVQYQNQGSKKNILIYGAGDLGLILKKSIDSTSQKNYNIVGFIDDDIQKVSRYLNGIRIYNTTKDTDYIIKKNSVTDVIIATNKIEPSRKADFLAQMIRNGVRVRQIGSFQNWYEQDFSLHRLASLNINDLMCRQLIDIKNKEIESSLYNKVVFVTGAAGSIGSELVRKLIENKAYFIVCIDFSESALYDLQQSIISSKPRIDNIFYELADIRDKREMKMIFSKYHPDIVFHAAAYKHVPLLEEHPKQSVKTNVFGTENIVTLSSEFNVEKFILISSDKAVNPKSIMGITKRMAELIVRSVWRDNKNTKFIITRFGNVLGSNGSVVPLFKKQILQGGPVTVTHPDMERYFMTIPEACQLVLEAFVMGCGGEIFVFDMGKPVKILDLANNMIRLSGMTPGVDIKIQFTGIRNGEKLTEEIFSDREFFLNTHHEKIYISSEAEVSQNLHSKIIRLINQLNDLDSKDEFKQGLINCYQNLELNKKIRDINEIVTV